ncbi:isocitrate lyase/phosphoenolpyruvate mutase family protein [Mesorhizobium sp. M0296]|uniref:isocitrate lyase/phosphoenolpyruvate mutase family protein n=1 Tax=Mesorhizobium sp. M0296 TaxID=2956931 RepID=UPI00333D6BC3
MPPQQRRSNCAAPGDKGNATDDKSIPKSRMFSCSSQNGLLCHSKSMGHCRRSNNDGVGLKALATTSSDYALSKGKKDGTREVSRAESLTYAAEIAASTDIPVSTDLENGYADTPEGIADSWAMVHPA